ncbi:MAG: DinB family protein [Acidobacteriota bacterium]
MRASWKAIACIVLFFITLAGSMAAQNAKVASVLDTSEFVRDWEISKQFTLDVANAMPADLYTFKPAPEEMSFGEQINHIAIANAYRFNQITGVKTPFTIDLKNPPASDKASSMKLLEQSFDYVLQVLPNLTNEQLKRTFHVPSWKARPDPDGHAMILNMFVHTAHHRAQCEVYLRAKGIKPPDYTF